MITTASALNRLLRLRLSLGLLIIAPINMASLRAVVAANVTTPTVVKANTETFEATDCFDEQLINLFADSNIPGFSIAVIRQGRVAYEQGYGTRDAPGIGADENRPVLPSTPFRIASISKAITATTLVLLAQQGLVDLDDVVFGPRGVLHPLTEGHEDTIDPQIYNITIRHLLRHAGGFTSQLDTEDPYSDPTLSSPTVAAALGIPGPANCHDTIQYMLDGIPLLYPPGTSAAYSNFGYCILGRVIEGITNMSYEAAARKWLLDPAGVDANEMYLGKTRIKDIPPLETEYYAQAPMDCFGPSVYPGDGNVSCAYGGLMAFEVADSLGAWVASPRQILKILAATVPPHCKENDSCLLNETWREQVEERPSFYPSNSSFWIGLGWVIYDDSDKDDIGDHSTTRSSANSPAALRWQHDGGIPGTSATLIRMSPENGGYGYAATFNGNNYTALSNTVGLMDAIKMNDMAKCVGDNDWPVEYFADASTSGTSSSSNLEVRLFSSISLASFLLTSIF